jgi:signal transduction histidine kinase/HPt (histidine-containing phosphotransfer) domain-containing protein
MDPAAIRVLLVEDNLPDARLIAELLRESGELFAVTHCERLAEAQEHLRGRPPEAVLLDLSLPDSQGLATLERVLAAAPAVPVLVLTGLADQQLATEAIAKGAEDYLIKGETYGRVMARAIHYAIQRKRMLLERQETQRRLDLLVRMSLGVMAARNVQDLLQSVVDAACLLTDARLGVAGHGFVQGAFQVMAASRAKDAVPCPPGEIFRVKRGGVYLDLFRGHPSIRLSDAQLRDHPRWWGLPERHTPLRGLLAVRLVNLEGATDSVIMVSDKIEGDFSEEDETLLNQLAAITSLAMQHIEARTEAERANRAKSHFLANMSHELRTPMNAVLGMTDLALAEELSPSVRDCLQTVKESGDSLLELLNEILDFSRVEAGKLQLEATAFYLRPVLEKTLKTLGVRAYEKGLELACDVPADVPDHFLGDPLRLRQVLVNLVGNAIKFTSQGEVVVRVEAEGLGIRDWGLEGEEAKAEGAISNLKSQISDSKTQDPSPKTQIPKSPNPPLPNPQSLIPSPLTLHFSVSDTGIGISAEDQKNIFAPFTQADPSTTRQFGGTGLGLTIANSLVGLMGGRLWVDSRPQGGSIFHFTVRLGCVKTPGEEPADAAGDQLRGVPVLVVDDNSASRDIVRKTLASWSMQAEAVADVPAALAQLHEAAAAGRKHALVLANAELPGVDGFALVTWVKSKPSLADKVLLMISPTQRRAMAKRCAELDTLFLEKPISQSELLSTVLRALGGSAPRASGRAAAAAAPLRPAARPLRILLAEDTRPNQKLVVRILQKRGHAVEVAQNGAKALELLGQQDFDVVLMDVQMPVMDGYQATAEIRRIQDSRKSRIPVVAMTAHAMRGDEERCLAAGMDGYLAKPINAHQMIDLVERMAEDQGGRREAEEANCKLQISNLKSQIPNSKTEGPRPGVPGAPKTQDPLQNPKSKIQNLEQPHAIFDAAEALVRCAGQPEILADMVSFCLDNIDPWIEEMRAAAAARATAELARLAHRLRGTLVYLAAHAPEKLAGQVEQLASCGDAPAAAAALEALGDSLRRLQSALGTCAG